MHGQRQRLLSVLFMHGRCDSQSVGSTIHDAAASPPGVAYAVGARRIILPAAEGPSGCGTLLLLVAASHTGWHPGQALHEGMMLLLPGVHDPPNTFTSHASRHWHCHIFQVCRCDKAVLLVCYVYRPAARAVSDASVHAESLSAAVTAAAAASLAGHGCGGFAGAIGGRAAGAQCKCDAVSRLQLQLLVLSLPCRHASDNVWLSNGHLAK
jgi:hypothetical protein